MDITKTTEPKSDQQNFDDYVSGPKTVTITEVKAGSAEQPVELHLAEYPGRPFKPGKSMRRVLIACWGAEASAYVGRKMTLYGDPTVKFGGQTVGGIRIAALSHIDGPRTIALTVTRGKRSPFIVQPLGPARDWLAELEDADGDPDLIRALGTAARSAGAALDVLEALRTAFVAAKAQVVPEAQAGGEA
jgi:hypothetical protein